MSGVCNRVVKGPRGILANFSTPCFTGLEGQMVAMGENLGPRVGLGRKKGVFSPSHLMVQDTLM
eukprot:1142293-Pelagomonas_calceolata.AAC.2